MLIEIAISFPNFSLSRLTKIIHSQKRIFQFHSHLPSRCPVMAIGSPPSRLQIMFGCGEPRAAHLSVTLLPSLTTISVLVG